MTQIRSTRRLRLLAVLALALGLHACSLLPFESGETTRERLREARALWERQGIRSYRYTVAMTCFCPPERVGPVVVEVRDGATVSVTSANQGRTVAPGAFAGLDTVEELFAFIEQGLGKKPDETRTEYHPELGYPTAVRFDYERNAIDEENGILVSAFERLP
jgi:hypothetical protein